jgi:hypothetical protein
MTTKPPSPAYLSYIIDNNIQTNWVNLDRQTTGYHSLTISSLNGGRVGTPGEEIFNYICFAIPNSAEGKALPVNFFIHFAKQPWFSKCVFLSIITFGRIR